MTYDPESAVLDGRPEEIEGRGREYRVNGYEKDGR
jgi:hypothetical protein